MASWPESAGFARLGDADGSPNATANPASKHVPLLMRGGRWPTWGGAIGLSWAGSAMAQLAQLDGVLVPDQERSGAYFDTSRYNVDTLGLGTALDLLESGLVDYQADAAVEPSVFSPVFDLQASLIVRGESCHMDFGWYCIDHVPTSNPDQNFVPLVTADEVASYHDALRAST